jgi:TRAP-type C4-dicarboxylate transport system substrate-binding protein
MIRSKMRCMLAWAIASGVALGFGSLQAADPVAIRISTPAVPGDWHAEMLHVFEKEVEDVLPGRFDVQVFLNATLFKQSAEVAAMQRGNLDMGLPSAQDLSNQIPAWSIFTAGYLIRDPEHQQKVFASDVGEEMYGLVEEQMGIKVLGVAYLGTRQLNLRDQRGEYAGRPRRREAPHARLRGVAVPGRGARREPDPARLQRGLSGAPDRHHRRPGQSAADRPEG